MPALEKDQVRITEELTYPCPQHLVKHLCRAAVLDHIWKTASRFWTSRCSRGAGGSSVEGSRMAGSWCGKVGWGHWACLAWRREGFGARLQQEVHRKGEQHSHGFERAAEEMEPGSLDRRAWQEDKREWTGGSRLREECSFS